ncbi:unnamed protein product [Brassica rapa subsp. trilocularis]
MDGRVYTYFSQIVGGSKRGLTRRGDWRSLFSSITEVPQTKVEAERTDPEAKRRSERRQSQRLEKTEHVAAGVFFFSFTFRAGKKKQWGDIASVSGRAWWCKQVVVVRWRCEQHGRGVVSAAATEEVN